MGNPELFYDAQFSQNELTWEILSEGAPILRGILDDNDYTFNVEHSYSGMDDQSGMINMAKNAFNTAGDYVNYTKKLKQGLGSAVGGVAKNVLGLDKAGDVAKSFIDKSFDTASKFIEGGADLLGVGDEFEANLNRLKRSRFFNALDFIKVFQGTSINLNIPRLKTVILSEGPTGKTVKKTVAELNDKFVGAIENYGGLFGLQYSPNGYEPMFAGNSAKTEYPGTFTLRLGSAANLKNLILVDYSVTFSKHKRIYPDGKDLGDYLWAEVEVSLAPASYISKEMINTYYQLVNESTNTKK